MPKIELLLLFSQMVTEREEVSARSSARYLDQDSSPSIIRNVQHNQMELQFALRAILSCLPSFELEAENQGMKSLLFLGVVTLLVSPGFSQITKPALQTEQQVLEELRAIHRDLRASTTLQLLLAELQLTQTSLDRVTQRRDTLKGQVTQLQAEKTSAQAEVTRYEAGMEKVSNPDQQFVERLGELRDGLRKVTAQETATSEQLEDAERRLRTAQAERDSVQGQLSDLMRKLSSVN